MVLLAILDQPWLWADAPTVPGIVILIVNAWQLLLSTPHSTSQSNTSAIVFPLMLLSFEVIFLIMYTVQYLVPPSWRSSNLTCSQKSLHQSLPVMPMSSMILPGYVIKRPARDACLCMGELQAPPAPHFVFLITL